MGIHDRPYMREESGWRRRDARSWTARIVIAAVVATILVTASRNWFGTAFWPYLRLTPDWITLQHWWAPVTYPFATIFGWEIVSALVAFWFVGHMAEVRMTRGRFLVFVLGATLAGAGFHLAGQALGPIAGMSRRELDGWGTIATACLFRLAAKDPDAKVQLGFFDLKAWIFAGMWLLLDFLVSLRFFNGVSPQLWAHVGGAALGAATTWVSLPEVFARAGRRRAAAPQPRPDFGPARRSTADHDRVDALLEKIGRDGMSALTDEERDFLKTASKRYGSQGRT